ncbi:hypothetical protein SS1G_02210 [Sclerotinia sclerotiorum 1980 UF-70]|uniref:Serine aminopeptidase S33 domain-containing protein n=1 Tax=Sclerotinia sclerotiorum (strain ATCC 18683 / 1980 / Ss-1) TaxID=665079 RepID=A7EA78_SCLS1|nr:hypothetical protein SS1G_02210 [Sclerotinia sclerotiorum 1980 UF-70]EDN99356.1 hypothetical protein SS1G_02210 [Sclerotinia sclerotiorum 1980 UF-70]
MTLPPVNVEYKTIDGVIIRGVLYPTEMKAPAIIMTPGVNLVKELLVPEIAQRFQSRGYNALIYDARGIGESDGLPRNQIDPLQQSEDLSGRHFNAYLVITKCRFESTHALGFFQPGKREKAMALAIRDRQSQLRGNEASTVALFNSKGENPLGFGGSGGPGGVEAYNFISAAIDRGQPNFHNRITLQSFQKLIMFRPKVLLDMIQAASLMIVPELDNVSSPDEQVEAFGLLPSPKKLYMAKGKEHANVVSGEGSEETLDVMMEFMNTANETEA